MLRPPSDPRRLAPLREQRTDGGSAPGPPHRCAPGEAAHRCGLRPRPAGGPGRLRRGAGPPAPQRRGPRGRERRRRAVAIGDLAGRRPPPAHGRVRSLPAGISRAAGAGCKRPPARKGRVRRALPSGQFFDKERGVACSPHPGPEIHRGRSRSATGRTGIVLSGTQITPSKRGGLLSCVRTWPRRGAFRAGIGPVSRLARDSRPPGDVCRRRSASRPDDGHLSSWKASTSPSRRWSSRWRRAGQAFEGVVRSCRCSPGCGSRSRTSPAGVLKGGVRSCRYLFRLGAADHSGCDARGDVHCWRSRITIKYCNDLRGHRSGPPCRGTDLEVGAPSRPRALLSQLDAVPPACGGRCRPEVGVPSRPRALPPAAMRSKPSPRFYSVGVAPADWKASTMRFCRNSARPTITIASTANANTR